MEQESQEWRLRRQELLTDLLESLVWREVLAPVLAGRLQELQRRAMAAKTLEDLRQFQGAYQALEQMLRDLKGFCGVDRGERDAAQLAVEERGE